MAAVDDVSCPRPRLSKKRSEVSLDDCLLGCKCGLGPPSPRPSKPLEPLEQSLPSHLDFGSSAVREHRQSPSLLSVGRLELSMGCSDAPQRRTPWQGALFWLEALSALLV